MSIPFDEIMVRTKSFLAAGYREIILTGCNLSLYHWSDHNLATLLAALAELGTDPGVLGTDPEILVGTVPNVGTVPARIRIGSLEPGRVCEAV